MHDRDGNLAEKLQPAVMTLRIIVAALASGVLFFAAVAGFVRLSGPAEPDGAASNLLTIVAMFPSPSRVANWIEQQLRLMDDEKMLAR